MISAITNYFQEAISELKKVIWPTRQETINHTVSVVVICLFIAAFLGLLDLLFLSALRAVGAF